MPLSHQVAMSGFFFFFHVSRHTSTHSVTEVGLWCPFKSPPSLIHFPLWSELYGNHQQNLEFFTASSGRFDSGRDVVKMMNVHRSGISSSLDTKAAPRQIISESWAWAWASLGIATGNQVEEHYPNSQFGGNIFPSALVG